MDAAEVFGVVCLVPDCWRCVLSHRNSASAPHYAVCVCLTLGTVLCMMCCLCFCGKSVCVCMCLLLSLQDACRSTTAPTLHDAPSAAACGYRRTSSVWFLICRLLLCYSTTSVFTLSCVFVTQLAHSWLPHIPHSSVLPWQQCSEMGHPTVSAGKFTSSTSYCRPRSIKPQGYVFAIPPMLKTDHHRAAAGWKNTFPGFYSRSL